MRGVFLDLDTVSHQGDVDLAPLHRALGELRTFGTTPDEQVAQRVDDLDVVLTNKVKLGTALIGRFTRVRLICVAATGFNNVDIGAAKRAASRSPTCRPIPRCQSCRWCSRWFWDLPSISGNTKRCCKPVPGGARRSSPC